MPIYAMNGTDPHLVQITVRYHKKGLCFVPIQAAVKKSGTNGQTNRQTKQNTIQKEDTHFVTFDLTYLIELLNLITNINIPENKFHINKKYFHQSFSNIFLLAHIIKYLNIGYLILANSKPCQGKNIIKWDTKIPKNLNYQTSYEL